MKRALLAALALFFLISASVRAESECRFDIILVPDHDVTSYSYNGRNVFAKGYSGGVAKITVYNQKMKKVDEYYEHEKGVQPRPLRRRLIKRNWRSSGGRCRKNTATVA